MPEGWRETLAEFYACSWLPQRLKVLQSNKSALHEFRASHVSTGPYAKWLAGALDHDSHQAKTLPGESVQSPLGGGAGSINPAVPKPEHQTLNPKP